VRCKTGSDRERLALARDVVAAVREQNPQAATGQVGAPPAPKGQQVDWGNLPTPDWAIDAKIRTRKLRELLSEATTNR